MPTIQEELTKNNEEKIHSPTMSQGMEHLHGESLMFFGINKRNKKNYRMFYGIGYVSRIVKGEKADMIYINFGMFAHRQPRLVIAHDNIARRQVATLKRGQVCQIYGMCRYYTHKVDVNGYEVKNVKLGLYAKGINGWYVPTMMDIRRLPTNEDIVEPSEKEQGLIDMFEDVLDQFMNGTGEE